MYVQLADIETTAGNSPICRGLENTVRKHAGAGGSSSSAFTGKGHTLGGSSPATTSAPLLPGSTLGLWNNMDPQAKVLVCLLGAYAVFWWFS